METSNCQEMPITLQEALNHLKANFEPCEIVNIAETIIGQCVSDFMLDAARTDDDSEKELLISYAIRFTDARKHLLKAEKLVNPYNELNR